MDTMAMIDVVVIGGSTGSSAVLKRLLGDLPPDLAASIFICTHMPAQGTSFLGEMLASSARLPVSQAFDGQPIERGRIYVASPDRHLLLIGDTITLGFGPKENMARPAIDPLFRSAALSFGPRVVGVVLSGMLDDGASGLGAIKARGGTTIVQHPLDAQADQMPLAALQASEVDYVAGVEELGATLAKLVRTPAGPAGPITNALRLEVEIASGRRLDSEHLRELGQPSALSCPECQGVLSEIRGSRPLRFRCQIGHGYTAEALASQIDEVDEAVRVAMRIMEERVTLVMRMAEDARESGRRAVAELYDARAQEYQRYAATLRDAATASLRMSTDRAQEM